MFVNELEVIRMRHGELQREAAAARLAKVAMMAQREEAKAVQNARTISPAPTSTAEMKKARVEPKLVTNAR